MKMIKSLRKILPSQSGIAALEFALIAPVFILMIAAVIDFGWYFTRSYIVQRSLSTISAKAQLNPPTIIDKNDTAQVTAYNAAVTELAQAVRSSSMGVVDFEAEGNQFCALGHYSTASQAQNQTYYNVCNTRTGIAVGDFGNWPTSQGTPRETPYYVYIRVKVEHKPLFPVKIGDMNFGVPDEIKFETVLEITPGGVNRLNVPTDCEEGEILTSEEVNGKQTFVCKTLAEMLPPDQQPCNSQGQVIRLDDEGKPECRTFAALFEAPYDRDGVSPDNRPTIAQIMKGQGCWPWSSTAVRTEEENIDFFNQMADVAKIDYLTSPAFTNQCVSRWCNNLYDGRSFSSGMINDNGLGKSNYSYVYLRNLIINNGIIIGYTNFIGTQGESCAPTDCYAPGPYEYLNEELCDKIQKGYNSPEPPHSAYATPQAPFCGVAATPKTIPDIRTIKVEVMCMQSLRRGLGAAPTPALDYQEPDDRVPPDFEAGAPPTWNNGNPSCATPSGC